jgi:hypothetical protein
MKTFVIILKVFLESLSLKRMSSILMVGSPKIHSDIKKASHLRINYEVNYNAPIFKNSIQEMSVFLNLFWLPTHIWEARNCRPLIDYQKN